VRFDSEVFTGKMRVNQLLARTLFDDARSTGARVFVVAETPHGGTVTNGTSARRRNTADTMTTRAFSGIVTAPDNNRLVVP
jgi:hypothetical protein